MAISWTFKQVSIAKMQSMFSPVSDERIDCDPVGQRPDVDSIDKKRGIIDLVLRGNDFGEIKLRELENDPEYKYSSIDGGHRKRAIRDFIDGGFTTSTHSIARIGDRTIDVGHRLFKDLPEEVKMQFLNYGIRFTIYGKEMTDEEAGETFRCTNISTNVNDQERRNSYLNNLVSKFVREISRPIRGLDNDYHILFLRNKTKKGENIQPYFKNFTSRLRDDEYVTRLLVILNKDKNDANYLTCSADEAEDFYVTNGNKTSGNWMKNPSLMKTQTKRVISALNFIHKFAETQRSNVNKGLSPQEMTFLIRLYSHWVREHGEDSIKVEDWDKFHKEFKLAWFCFVGKSATRTETIHEDRDKRPASKCFTGYMQVHGDQRKCQRTVEWFLEEFDFDNSGIIFLDPVRNFSKEIREQVWIKQDKKCWVTGLPLAFEDAESGHIVAHSKGGRTTIENCAVVHKNENSVMSSMDAMVYKSLRLQDAA